MHLIENLDTQLLNALHTHKGTVGWKMTDIKGMDPFIFTQRVALEDDAKHSR